MPGGEAGQLSEPSPTQQRCLVAGQAVADHVTQASEARQTIVVGEGDPPDDRGVALRVIGLGKAHRGEPFVAVGTARRGPGVGVIGQRDLAEGKRGVGLEASDGLPCAFRTVVFVFCYATSC